MIREQRGVPADASNIGNMSDAEAKTMHEALIATKREELAKAKQQGSDAWIASAEAELHQLENVSRRLAGEDYVPYLGSTDEEREKTADKIQQAQANVVRIETDDSDSKLPGSTAGTGGWA
jgi:hypothetical protein